MKMCAQKNFDDSQSSRITSNPLNYRIFVSGLIFLILVLFHSVAAKTTGSPKVTIKSNFPKLYSLLKHIAEDKSMNLTHHEKIAFGCMRKLMGSKGEEFFKCPPIVKMVKMKTGSELIAFCEKPLDQAVSIIEVEIQDTIDHFDTFLLLKSVACLHKYQADIPTAQKVQACAHPKLRSMGIGKK